MKLQIFALYISVFITISLTPLSNSYSQSPSAMDAIRELLPLVCGEFTNNGSSNSLKIAGDANVKLNGLIKRLADLGITGKAEFNSDEYVGVLREQVGEELKDVRQCRQKVYDDLKNLFVNANTDRSIESTGNKNANLTGDGNSVSIK